MIVIDLFHTPIFNPFTVRDPGACGPSSFAAPGSLDVVINNLDSDNSSSGILVDLSRNSTPYSTEQMMAAIRELKNDVNLLAADDN